MRYAELAKIYDKLSSTSKRLEKTRHLAELIRESDELDELVLLVQGRIFPVWDTREPGVASKLLVKAIAAATAAAPAKVEEEWRRTGDLGTVAANLISNRRQSSLFPRELTLSRVIENLRKLSGEEGSGSVDRKLSLIKELLVDATPIEAKYIVRTILGDLRIGTAQGIVRDAIIWAFFGEELGIEGSVPQGKREEYNRISGEIQRAYDITNDFAQVIRAVRAGGLESLSDIDISVGKPISSMLFIKAADVEDAFRIVGSPAAFEYKYDGFRIQLHKDRGKVTLFTRRLEDVTSQFPDIADLAVRSIDDDSCILDCEVLGVEKETGRYLPFQSISQRIKRKHDIGRISDEYPVELNIFDALLIGGRSVLSIPFQRRREMIASIVRQEKGKIVLAKQIITASREEAEAFYAESLASGQEGVMAKKLDAPYQPGARVGFGVKIKPVMEPLDLVIIGAEYGEGKRQGWLSSYSLACWDENKEELLEIGRASTGLKELESEGLSFPQMTALLKPLVKKTSGKYAEVEPKVVIEVFYEEIQRSPTNSSGYALRFPRISRLREDKDIEGINDIDDVRLLYDKQRGRNL